MMPCCSAAKELPAPFSIATRRASISAIVLSLTMSDCAISVDTGADCTAPSWAAPAGAVAWLTVRPLPSASAKACPARAIGSSLRAEVLRVGSLRSPSTMSAVISGM